MDSGEATASAELVGPAGIGVLDSITREVIEDALQLVRERLDMEISWLAEFEDGKKVFRVVEGDREEWDLWEGSWMPETESYCRRMLDGTIPNAIPDTSQEPAVLALSVTQRLRIGSYIGVPLVLRSGELRGAFCCARHTKNTSLGPRDVRFLQVVARLVADELSFRETSNELQRLHARAASAEALATAVQARDEYTSGHSRSVVSYATAVARRLGIEADAVLDVEQVALLHDIGKVGIPDTVLHKPGPLTDEEWALMRDHPAIGAAMIENVGALAHLAPAIRAEHERWDGGGYPDGLSGEAIPEASRITFVCDAFHAMISDRPYRRAMSYDEALAELRRCSGAMFWPEAVDALVAELTELNAVAD